MKAVLREKQHSHIETSLCHPVLLVDEAREMAPPSSANCYVSTVRAFFALTASASSREASAAFIFSILNRSAATRYS